MNNILSKLTEEYIQKYNIDSLDIISNPRELVVLLVSEIKKSTSAKSKSTQSTLNLKNDILSCYLMNIFDIDEMATTLNVDAIKIEDCIVKDFTMEEIKDIPGFKFDRYFSPYEYIRVTAYLTKNEWNGQYRVLKNTFPEISYRSLKFIVKSFKKEA